MTTESKEQRPRRRRSGWYRKITITTILAALTASLPCAAFVREWFSKDRELALAEKQQDLATRKAYLDQALDPARPAELRQSVLRYIVKTSADRRLEAWAREELALVDKRVDELREDLGKVKDLLAKQQEEMSATIAALERERRARKLDAKSLADAKDKVAELDRSRADLESRIASLRERLSGDVVPRRAAPAPPADPWDNSWAEDFDKRGKLDKKTAMRILLDIARNQAKQAPETEAPRASPH